MTEPQECEHNPERYYIEEVEHDSPNPDSSYYWTEKIYVCGDCDAEIPSDVADPAVDAADARADYEYESFRDSQL